MKLERTKNASRNMVYGTILRLYQILVPFIIRTIMIYFLGMEYVGLNSLFNSILNVLNLAELGVGSAMIFSMYKPIAQDDTKLICALMQLYKKLYRIIGAFVAIAGVSLLPFLKFLIKDEVPADINVYLLYLVYLGTTVLSYWLWAYKGSILQAYQRTDIVSKCTLIVMTLQYVFQIIALIAFRNYYLYVIAILFSQIFLNLFIGYTASKAFPQYSAQGEIDKEERKSIFNRIKDLFTAKLGSVVILSADTIVISAFLGLSVLAVYQNYFFIMQAVTSILTIIYTSCMAGVGNSFVMETEEKNYKDFKTFSFLITWAAGLCTSMFLVMYQPFMTLWIGKEGLLDDKIVLCLSVSFYISEINQLLCMYKDATGKWHEDRFRSLIAAAVNLILNIIVVNFWGLYGVVLSTVFANLVVSIPWLIRNIFSTIFKESKPMKYVLEMLKYALVALVMCVIIMKCCSLFRVGVFASMVIYAIISFFLFNGAYILLYHKKEEYEKLKRMVTHFFKK